MVRHMGEDYGQWMIGGWHISQVRAEASIRASTRRDRRQYGHIPLKEDAMHETKDGRERPEERRSGAGDSGYKDPKEEPWVNIVHGAWRLQWCTTGTP